MDDLVRDLKTPEAAAGLSEADAKRRLTEDGPNELPVSKPRSVLRLAREVASEPMFLLLVACGAIYMLLGDRQEALMLLGFVFVFVVMAISFVQQRSSGAASIRWRRCAIFRARGPSPCAAARQCAFQPVNWWWATWSWSLRATGRRQTCDSSRPRTSLSMNRC